MLRQGEEIGMENYMDISWEMTKDPQACNTNETVYKDFSRDPVRTPFQWDNTKNAGFSKAEETWLPVNPNYLEINLAAQKDDEDSWYNMYRTLIKIRKEPAFKFGETMVKGLKDENILVVLRSLGEDHYLTAINFEDASVTVDLTTLVEESNQVPEAMVIYATKSFHDHEGHDHDHDAHEVLDAKKFQLGPYDAVIVKLGKYTNSAASLSVSIAVMFLALVRFFLP